MSERCDICGGRGFDYLGRHCRVCNPNTGKVPTFTVVDQARWDASACSFSSLVAQVAAVRKLHVRTENGSCAECRDNYGYGVEWPCSTIDALDREVAR